MHSVHLPSCPPLEGYVRGSVYRSGFVFRETDRSGVLELVSILDMDLKGSVPDAIVNMTLETRILSMAYINEHFDMKNSQPTQLKILGDTELRPKESVAECYLCRESFGVLPKKCNCRQCGEVIQAYICDMRYPTNN